MELEGGLTRSVVNLNLQPVSQRAVVGDANVVDGILFNWSPNINIRSKIKHRVNGSLSQSIQIIIYIFVRQLHMVAILCIVSINEAVINQPKAMK